MPTTPAAVARLGEAFNEAALEICDSALAAVGGRASPAAADDRRVPSLNAEAEVRSALGACLFSLHEDRPRALDLNRQAVALMRQVARTNPNASNCLAGKLGALASMLEVNSVGTRNARGSDESAEAEALLREALPLSEATEDVRLQLFILARLVNMSGQPDQTMALLEAEALRARMNGLQVQTGRIPDTSCGGHRRRWMDMIVTIADTQASKEGTHSSKRTSWIHSPPPPEGCELRGLAAHTAGTRRARGLRPHAGASAQP